MFRSKYSTVLTVFLVIIIIAIIVLATIVAIKAYNNYQAQMEANRVYAELVQRNQTTENNTDEPEENILINVIENQNNTENSSENTTSKPSKPKRYFYKNYVVAGYIKIEKTKIEYPILLDISPAALETSVGIMYPSNNPQLNKPGITVIIGHNYRNGKFFSNNKNLNIGDKIQITDLDGKTLSYTIYEKSIIPETDTEYITRDRGNNIEIALSTCTDDGKDRIVLLARAD